MRRSTLFCAPLLVLALLAGCDQGDGSLGDTPEADSDSPADISDGPDEAEQKGHGSGGSSCLVGSWEPADMSEYGVDSIELLGGTFDFTMTFDGSTVSFGITSAVPTTDYTEDMSMTVTAEGDYAVSGDTIKVSGVTGSITIDGEEQLDDSGLGFGGVDEGESTFSCSGDALAIDGEKFSRK
jgi:hypothetical protein